MSDRVIEFRIHGVSGTPPEQMLGRPVEPDPRFPPEQGSEPRVWRRADRADGRLAYRWSSLTSGRPVTALWLTLLPYMLLNLAGWALPPGDGVRHRLATITMRLAGLALTVVFSMVTAIGFNGVGAVQVLGDELGSWAIPGGVLASVILVVTVWVAAAVPQGDPLTDRPHLRSVHVAMALWSIWWVSAAAAVERGSGPILDGLEPGRAWAVWALPAYAALVTVARDLTRGRRLFFSVQEWGLLLVSVCVLGWESLATGLGAATDSTSVLHTIDDPLRVAVAWYMTLVLACTILSMSSRAPRAFVVVAALSTLAGTTGSAIGAALIEVSAWVSGGTAPSGIPIVAESFLTGALAVLVVLALVTLLSVERGSDPARTAVRTGVVVRDRVVWVLSAIALATSVLVVATFRRLDGSGQGTAYAASSGILLTGLLVTAGIAAVRMGFCKTGFVSAAAGISVMTWWDRLPYTGTAITLTLLAPLVLVAIRIRGAWGDRARRRVLAIPWDVGSFFGRRYHPFAPPSYGETARRELAHVIGRLPADSRVILGGHSQGSVVGAVTVELLERDVRLLTYGSPLGSLYSRYFPRAFGPNRWTTVSEQVNGAWINLWRPTDPVAGPVGAGADDRRMDDPDLRIHGGYWRDDEPMFTAAVTELSDADDQTAPVGEPADRLRGRPGFAKMVAMDESSEREHLERELENARRRLAAAEDQLISSSYVGADGPGGGGFTSTDLDALNTALAESLDVPGLREMVSRLERRLDALEDGPDAPG